MEPQDSREEVCQVLKSSWKFRKLLIMSLTQQGLCTLFAVVRKSNWQCQKNYKLRIWSKWPPVPIVHLPCNERKTGKSLAKVWGGKKQQQKWKGFCWQNLQIITAPNFRDLIAVCCSSFAREASAPKVDIEYNPLDSSPGFWKSAPPKAALSYAERKVLQVTTRSSCCFCWNPLQNAAVPACETQACSFVWAQESRREGL